MNFYPTKKFYPSSKRKAKKLWKYKWKQRDEFAPYWKKYKCEICGSGFKTWIWHLYGGDLIFCVGGEPLCINCICHSHYNQIDCEEHCHLL